eukprot:CAMPEP_0181184348 /NCGR_PEP_ID=MMETSP1096-20121128/8916_1 /TAXON_ID=156174 ORGANISM="Chrysochromulina ericina, Strain CCMP281" /NCGR_SAMPLE_ID=MMETSP1096 /ASSEMBLY_ACC=CAM_ASM_000453 /LENGTH=74 /DNA_ID=CAMNT_0023273099 /DNA_START=308 /DNA_END=529 /DNA_ORIENTATION=+
MPPPSNPIRYTSPASYPPASTAFRSAPSQPSPGSPPQHMGRGGIPSQQLIGRGGIPSQQLIGRGGIPSQQLIGR